MPRKRIGVKGYDRTKGGRRESVRPHTRSVTIRLEKPFYQTLNRYAKRLGYRDVPAFLETFLPEYGRDEWEPELEQMEGSKSRGGPGPSYPISEGGAAVTNDEGVTFRVGDRITPVQRLTMPGDPTGEDDLMPGDTYIVSAIREDGNIELEGFGPAWNDWEPNWFTKAGA